MRSVWERHPAVPTGGQLKFRERAADTLKAAFGTWTLLFAIVIGIAMWMTLAYDPGELHLNLALSFLASVQGVILQIAANRGDKINAAVAIHTLDNTLLIRKVLRLIRTLLVRQVRLTEEIHQYTRQLRHMQAELNIIRSAVAPGIPNPVNGVDAEEPQG